MIVTFYSFKGGVGRSMSLANVGEILADWGYHVILCDWDLEAPGLERYMTSLESCLAASSTEEESAKAYEQAQREAVEYKQRPGLMDLLIEYKRTMTRAPVELESRLKREADGEPDEFQNSFEKVGRVYLRRPSTYAFPVSDKRPPNRPPRAGSLRLLTAGSRKDYERYAESVRSFRWEEFYEEWAGGSYVEFFRSDLEREADVVLVDSRTGVTEHGGVATHHLADMVVLLSAANQMNIEGTQWMAGELSDPTLKESRGGRNLQVLPLPSRIEQTAEKADLVAFRGEFARDFGRYAPLLGEGDAKDFFFDVEIPYIPFYSFKERIVAREEEGKRERNLYESYEAVAHHIVKQGESAGLLKARSGQGRAFARARTHSDKQIRRLRAPVLLSYAAGERDAARTLEEGLKGAGVEVVVTPSSRCAPPESEEHRKFESAAAKAAGHIILAGREGFDPKLKAEYDHALRQCVLRTDFRLVTLLTAGADPKMLPPYAARLLPFELPADLDSSSPDLFRNIAAELGSSATALPAEDDAPPFLGFEHFDEDRARFFFGRDAEVAELTGLLGDTPHGHVRWLQIEGSNGSGKTSLARAGLVPALPRGLVRGVPADWVVAKPTLGKNIRESLASAFQDLGLSQSELHLWRASVNSLSEVIRTLTPPDHAFLLVLDNLEILFDAEDPPEETWDFAEQVWSALLEPGLPFYLVTTLRSDYVPQIDSVIPLSLAAQMKVARQYQLKRMGEDALGQAITCPLKLAGLNLEEGLLERIVSEVSETEEPLALLGSIMRGLWEKRTGNLLTHGAYQKLGGVRGVLLQNADALANDLLPPQLERARKFALELVKSGPAPVTGQPHCGAVFSMTYGEALSAAGGDSEAKALLDRLLAAPRLLVLRDGRVGFLHESLVRHWGRLRIWVDGSREFFARRETIAARALASADPFLRWSQTLQLSAENWEKGGRSDKLLLSGPALAEAKRMFRAHAEDLNEVEREFIASSGRRAARRLYRVAAVSAALVLIVSLASVLLYRRQRTADIQTAGSVIVSGLEKVRQGRSGEAVEDFTRAIELDPSSHEARYQRGLAYESAGRREPAQADFREAIRLKPDFADAYKELALSLARANRHEEAISTLTKFVELSPDSSEAYLYRGSANAALGRREEAMRDFDKAIELDSKSAEAYNARATLYRDAGDFNRALDDYNRAIAVNERYVEALNNRGYTYENAQPPNYDLAIEDYSKAIGYDGQFAEAYFNRGTARARKGEYEAALDDFTKAIERNSGFAQAFSGRCEVNLKFTKNLEAALSDCAQATKINPDLTEAFVNLGQVYAASADRYDEALQSYNRALELNRGLAEVYLYRGELYKKQDRGKAVTDLLQFLSLTSDPALEARARSSLKELGYQTPPEKTTVSLRTPAGNEHITGLVRDKLTSRRYTVQTIVSDDVPDEESSVRYFQPEDERSAGDVKKIIEDTINGEGYSFTFQRLDGLVRYGRSRRVPIGTIEVRIPLVTGK